MLLEQSRLNIETRSRTSRLPWRGQFSPEFIEYIMQTVCHDSRSFLDPFCGSGTVLFESIERKCQSWGIEVNPAAWHLASIAEFSSLSSTEKVRLNKFAKSMLAQVSVQTGELFRETSTPDDFLAAATEYASSNMEARILAAAIIIGMGNGNNFDVKSLQKGLFAISSVLNRVIQFDGAAECILGDARSTGLLSETVEAIITSPPYINVFNYHQNYRPAVELLGWKPLQAAKVEIGSNRKFRQNRFLTVIQYCIDMQIAIAEMARVMKSSAPLVIVLGRTSNVLNCSFENGAIVKKLLENSSSFDRIQCAERVFTSRYGGRIFEDVIMAERKAFSLPDVSTARAIGREALRRALSEVSDTNRTTLLSAIECSDEVKASPTLKMEIPVYFDSKHGKEKNGSYSNCRARG